MFIFFLMTIVIWGCRQSDKKIVEAQELLIIEKTYEQLTEYEKTIVLDKLGSVEEVVVEKNDNRYFIEEQYYGDSVYLVRFSAKNEMFTGKLTKLVEKETMRIVGYGYRE